jgi:hypothetical protein
LNSTLIDALHAPGRPSQAWLTIARSVWVFYVVVALLLTAIGLPGYYAGLLQPSSSFLGIGWTAEALARALASLGLSTEVVIGLVVVPDMIRALVFTAVGGLIFWRKSDEWWGLFASFVMVGIGWAIGSKWEWLGHLPQIWQQILSIPIYIVWPALFVFLTIYPDGRFVPSLTRYSTIAWLTLGITPTLFFFNQDVPGWLGGLLLVLLATTLIVQIYRYRRVFGPVERLQTRWFLYSVAVIFGVLLSMQYLIGPNFNEPGPSRLIYTLANHILGDVCFVLLPISVGIAILRYRLWDIDLIIRRTLIYSVITGTLALVYFGIVILLQQLFRAFTTAGGDLAIIISTLAIAALFNPLRKRVQDTIDRRFYRRKYDAQKVLAEFAVTARDETDLIKLAGELVRVATETLQPDGVSIWLQDGRSASKPRGGNLD